MKLIKNVHGMTDSLSGRANNNIWNINLASTDSGSDELDIYRSLFIYKITENSDFHNEISWSLSDPANMQPLMYLLMTAFVCFCLRSPSVQLGSLSIQPLRLIEQQQWKLFRSLCQSCRSLSRQKLCPDCNTRRSIYFELGDQDKNDGKLISSLLYYYFCDCSLLLGFLRGLEL